MQKEKMIYCSRCVMPLSTVNLSMNAEGICSACEFHKVYQSISPDGWEIRKKNLRNS